MLKKEELIRTEEYWMENIQNELYYALKTYMQEHGLNQSELAGKLGFTKGYISQVLKGRFNHSMKKLIQLLLAIDRAPKIEFIHLDEQRLEIRSPLVKKTVLREE